MMLRPDKHLTKFSDDQTLRINRVFNGYYNSMSNIYIYGENNSRW